MIRKIFLTVAATLVAVTGLFAQELPDDPEVRKGVLDNGMTYYIRHNNKPANQAEFWIFDNVGALQEMSLIHISEPTRQAERSYAVFCLKKKTRKGLFAKKYCSNKSDGLVTWCG